MHPYYKKEDVFDIFFLHFIMEDIGMSDICDKETRSAIMRKVKSKGNRSTELRLMGVFHEQRITGWRRNYPVKGHPDFVFLDEKVAVFVDGCFWHGHGCRKKMPEDNKEFWINKVSTNKARDIIITERFEARGWNVIRIWECELKKKNEHIVRNKLTAGGLLKSQNNMF